MTSTVKTGIYYGFARVYEDHAGEETKGVFSPQDLEILPMVMSLGWNPYYKNEKLTAVCAIFRSSNRLITDDAHVNTERKYT